MGLTDLIKIAKATAREFGLPPDLVCAVAEHESGGWKPWAFKPETDFQKKYVDPQPHLSVMENWGRSQSWGLMQIMGQTARELGFKGEYLSELCDPATGLQYGCKKLARCMANHPGDLRAALLAYNGGANPQYPDLVLPLRVKYQDAAPQ